MRDFEAYFSLWWSAANNREGLMGPKATIGELISSLCRQISGPGKVFFVRNW